MNWRPVQTAGMLVLLTAFQIACGKTAAPKPEKGMSFEEAQNTLRAIGVAELAYFAKNNRYATLEELTQGGHVHLGLVGQGQDGYGYDFKIALESGNFKATAQCYAPKGGFCMEFVTGSDQTAVMGNIRKGE